MNDDKHVTRHELNLELSKHTLEMKDHLRDMLDEHFAALQTRMDTANIERRDTAFQEATGFEWKDKTKARETFQHFYVKMLDEKDTKRRAKMIFMGLTIPAGLAWIIDQIR